MNDKVKDFYNYLGQHKDLLQKIIHKKTSVQTKEEFIKFINEVLIPVSKEEGFDLDLQEFIDYEIKSLQALSSVELKDVSGGIGIKNFTAGGINLSLLLCGILGQPTFAFPPKYNLSDSTIINNLADNNLETLKCKITAEHVNEDNIIDLLHDSDSEEIKKLEDDLKKIDDKDFEKLDELAQQLFENENIKIVRNHKIAKDWIRNWFRFIKIFPCLKGYVELIESQDVHPSGYPDASAESILCTIHYYQVLVPQKYSGDTEDDLVRAKTKQVKNYNRKYIIVHELAHVLDQMFLNMDNKNIILSSVKNITGELAKQPNDEQIKKEIGKISPYAANAGLVMYEEAFAEALTDVFINGQEATSLSKDIVKSLINKNINTSKFEFFGIPYEENLEAI